LYLNLLAQGMLVEYAIEAVSILNLFIVDADNDVADFDVAILSLR
jgi:hypothetical protein